MRLSGLKELLHVYDTQDKGAFRRFKSSFFNIERDEVSAARQFIQELEKDGRTSANIISYDAFEDYLSRNGKTGLISADYLKKDSKSTKIFKAWQEETIKAIDFPPAPTSVSDK